MHSNGNIFCELAVGYCMQEVIDCAVGDCITGGYPGEAFRFIASPPIELGGKIATEKAYPFNGGTGMCKVSIVVSTAVSSER